MARQAPIPSNEKEPTGTSRLVAGARNQFDKRLNIIYNEIVKQVIKPLGEQRIQVSNSVAYIINAEYIYSLDQFELNRIYEIIDSIVRRNIMVDENGFPVNINNGERLWFFGNYVEPSYEQGTGQAYNELAIQAIEYESANPGVQSILMSEPYRLRIGQVAARTFNEMEGFTDDVIRDARRVMADGVALGQSSREIARNLKEKVGRMKDGSVGGKGWKARADKIAQTEIPGALRRAKRDEMQSSDVRYGIKSKLLHMSAFKDTSRPWHMARSGKLFTKKEIDTWYLDPKNAIYCYCTQVIVVLGDDGEPLSMGAVNKVIDMRKRFTGK